MKNLYFNFAVKSLINRAKQYRSLFAVSAVGICIMLAVLMVTDGMIDSMTEKTRQYYGGDLMLLGGKASGDNLLSDSLPVIDALREILPDNVEVSVRYKKGSGTKNLYFEGMSVQQRDIQGVDFSDEKALFEKFTFTEGNAEPRDSHDGIVISLPAAKKLGVHIGDSIVLLVDADNGFKNTITLVVTGIFQDSSVFGMYTSYVDYNSLVKVLGFEEPLIDKICIYYEGGSPSRGEIERVQSELEKRFSMFPLNYDKTAWQDYDPDEWPEIYCLVPLSANVTELQKLSNAIHAIVALIVAMLVIIISVGISSTFRVIVMKRAVESGTFRALGMKPAGLMFLYFTEVFVLLISGCAIGFAGAVIIARIASSYNLSFISGFDLFLAGGHLQPVFYAEEAVLLLAIIFVTTLGAVLFTLRKLIHISPVGALASVS